MEEYDANLESLKSELRNKFADPIARIANVAAHLETLRYRGNTVLPSGDAASFGSAISLMIEATVRAREFLTAARDQVDNVYFVSRENDYEQY
jgi:hypothetical protein